MEAGRLLLRSLRSVREDRRLDALYDRYRDNARYLARVDRSLSAETLVRLHQQQVRLVRAAQAQRPRRGRDWLRMLVLRWLRAGERRRAMR